MKWRDMCKAIDQHVYENEDPKKAYLRVLTKLHIFFNTKPKDLLPRPVRILKQLPFGIWMLDQSFAVALRDKIIYVDYRGEERKPEFPLEVKFHSCNKDTVEVHHQSLVLDISTR